MPVEVRPTLEQELKAPLEVLGLRLDERKSEAPRRSERLLP